MKLTIAAGLFVAASAAAFAQAPASSGQNSAQQPTPAQQPATSGTTQQSGSRSAADQTVTGCLTADDNIFTLTVMNATPGTTATTTVYTLAPGSGVDLKSHVNQMVTVKGTNAGPELQNSTRVVQTTPPSPAPTGTSGNAGSKGASPSGSPTVQTTAKARINAITMNVTDVQPATGRCGEVK